MRRIWRSCMVHGSKLVDRWYHATTAPKARNPRRKLTMSANTPMQETEFHLVVDSLLLRLQIRLDELPTNVDSELSSGILTLTFENGSKIIINRQTPNREIWVAAKSGGFHFRFVSTDWIDTRSGQSLGCLLTKVISQQSGTEFPIILN